MQRLEDIFCHHLKGTMKRALLVLVSILFLFVACKKNNTPPEFDYQKFSGVWVPYESVSSNGTISTGPFTSGSIFGVYAESVKLNPDRFFIPAVFYSPTNIFLKEDEKGSYQYNESQQLLIMNGIWRLEFVVERMNDTELWLNDRNEILKLRKQP